jgi:hypothetical protein
MHLTYEDFEGRQIRFTDERRAHIENHPEMVDQMSRIGETLRSPDRVIATHSDPKVWVYERFYEKTPVTRKYLFVVTKVLERDAFVLTAFYSSRAKKGLLLWPR